MSGLHCRNRLEYWFCDKLRSVWWGCKTFLQMCNWGAWGTVEHLAKVMHINVIDFGGWCSGYRNVRPYTRFLPSWHISIPINIFYLISTPQIAKNIKNTSDVPLQFGFGISLHTPYIGRNKCLKIDFFYLGRKTPSNFGAHNIWCALHKTLLAVKFSTLEHVFSKSSQHLEFWHTLCIKRFLHFVS